MVCHVYCVGMTRDHALHVLVQGAIAEVVRALRLEGKPDDSSDVRAAMETPAGALHGVTGHLRTESEGSLEMLVAEAKARITADQMLTLCDARLDLMEKGLEHASIKFTSLEEAARQLSETLRRPSSVASYTVATTQAEAALNRSSFVLVAG